MYIEDGTGSDYGQENEAYYSWGWLGDFVPDKYKWESDSEKNKFLEKLSSISKTTNAKRGYHSCEICNEHLGNSQIKVSYKGKIYTSPNKVAHYIEKHNYCPPREVLEAIDFGVPLEDKDVSLCFKELDFGNDPAVNQKRRIEKLQKALEKGKPRRF